MKFFVFWTGVINVLSGLALQFPAISLRLMPLEPPGMVLHIFGAMAVFLGIMLVFCSRDLPARGVLVAWEGVLRLVGFATMAGYGLFGGAGIQAALSGLVDGLFGFIYLVALPKFLGISLVDLLLDRSRGRRVDGCAA